MSELIQASIIAAFPPTLVGIASIIVSLRNKNKIETVHKLINSGLTVRIAEAKDLGNAEGQLQQIEIQEKKDSKT